LCTSHEPKLSLKQGNPGTLKKEITFLNSVEIHLKCQNNNCFSQKVRTTNLVKSRKYFMVFFSFQPPYSAAHEGIE
jgi:hypothetical protein